MLSLLTGSHAHTTEYAGFYKPPKLCFLQGEAGNFLWRRFCTQYASSTSYMREAVGCIFIRNATESAIATTLNFGGSGESTATYGGLGAMVGVPDFTNETIIWSSIAYATGASGGSNLSGSVTIPANTTVVLLICSTSYYYTGQETCYFKFLHWQLNQIRSVTLTAGLEIDFNVTKRAWQHPGFENAFDIFQPEAGLDN
jgi:hypothetical protein